MHPMSITDKLKPIPYRNQTITSSTELSKKRWITKLPNPMCYAAKAARGKKILAYLFLTSSR